MGPLTSGLLIVMALLLPSRRSVSYGVLALSYGARKHR